MTTLTFLIQKLKPEDHSLFLLIPPSTWWTIIKRADRPPRFIFMAVLSGSLSSKATNIRASGLPCSGTMACACHPSAPPSAHRQSPSCLISPHQVLMATLGGHGGHENRDPLRPPSKFSQEPICGDGIQPPSCRQAQCPSGALT